MHSKEELLEWYNTVLSFPYFGRNWDSLYDLLSDTSWMNDRHVWLFHHRLPDLSDKDLSTYVKILYDASFDRTIAEKNGVHFGFSDTLRSSVERLLGHSVMGNRDSD